MISIINPDVQKYLSNNIEEKDPLLRKIEIYASKNKIPILDPASSRLFELLLELRKPESFLEIGTAIGYSAIRAARILKSKVGITTLELSSDNVKLAKSFFGEAGLSDIINLIEVNALDFLRETNDLYDFIFLDADKEDYPEYLELVIERMLPGGLLLVDNLLWKGFVASNEVPGEYKKSTEFIREFNARFLNHNLLKSTIVPVGDGLGLAVKSH